jgi:hypothetical protein
MKRRLILILLIKSFFQSITENNNENLIIGIANIDIADSLQCAKRHRI